MQRLRWSPSPPPAKSDSARSAAGHARRRKPRRHSIDEPVEWKDLLDWQRDNEYLLTGYRRASYSIRRSLKTIGKLHNETSRCSSTDVFLGHTITYINLCFAVNIWSHMLGAAVFLSWPIYSYLQVSPRYEKANPGDKEALFVYLLGVIVCFVLSTV